MSRQARKEAAAVARDLLKVDAAWVRKAGAAPMRKAAAAPMRKDAAARVPEQSSSGCDAGTPPRSFNDRSYFFNGSAGDFFGSAGQSSQPWEHQSSDPAMWGTNATPPGGFTNFIQPQLSQNFIFGGEHSQYAPFRPPRTSLDVQSEEEFRTPISAKDNNTHISVDKVNISSWLLNSTDSTVDADRKNDQYWTDVEATYNETAPSHRRRNAKQIKDRFHKVNKWTDLFHSAWLKARMVFSSGYNDQMWIETAHAFYIKDNEKLNLGPFVLMDVWKILKTEAKWITYNNGLKAARKRKDADKEKEGEDNSHIDVDELDEQPRPMRQKAAKQLKYAKNKEVDQIDLEELEIFGKLQCEEHANRLKVLEMQAKLSSEKIEQTKLAHLAAKEQKEAAEMKREARKYELETKMFETYNRLLSMDLSLMSD
ncbi:unnamed protein product [Urochloa humidicola]